MLWGLGFDWSFYRGYVDNFMIVMGIKFDVVVVQGEQGIVVIMVDFVIRVEVGVVLMNNNFVSVDKLIVEMFYVEMLGVGVMIVV